MDKEAKNTIEKLKNRFDLPDCQFYGFIGDEKENFITMFKDSKQNPTTTTFPDFLSGDNIIEHFTITSAPENKNGSKYREQLSKLVKKQEKEKELSKKLDELNYEKVDTVSSEMTHENNSYDNLIKSFKKNFEGHIEHLKKYKEKYRKVVFVIDCKDCDIKYTPETDKLPEGLEPFDLLVSHLERGLNFDDYGNRITNWYRLSRDKEILQYLQLFKDLIDYVVFFNGYNTECFALNRLDVVMAFVKKCSFNSVMKIDYKITVGAHIKNRF